jgi:hypothetical protein
LLGAVFDYQNILKFQGNRFKPTYVCQEVEWNVQKTSGIYSHFFMLRLEHMRNVLYIVLIITALARDSHARTESSATKDIVRSALLNYFTPYSNIGEGEKSSVENELLNTKSDTKLFYPPFPRTWIERTSSENTETTTTATFDTSKLFTAINSFAGPLTAPITTIFNSAQLGYKYEKSIKYNYAKQTTLMVMTSWRQQNNSASPQMNNNGVAKDVLLHSVIVQKPDLRTYFKVSEEFPLLGMCKYEMSLAIQKSTTNTLSFVMGSTAEGNTIVDSMSYTVYSNFFQIEGHVPIQDYLQVRCGENFSETVRFLVESEFNKMVTDTFAHYHPKAECRWSPPSASTPKTGDQDCVSWFKKLNILGLDKKTTVPRCVLGEEGFPVCVAKTSKIGAYCPLYSYRGKISTKEPVAWDRQLNPMDNTGTLGGKMLYPCDQGLECRLDNGKPVSSIPLSNDIKERMRQLQNANYITTCQPIMNRGGR